MNELERNKLMEQVVAECGHMMLSIASSFDRNAAEDIRQDAYVKVLQNLDRFDGNLSALRTYASTITKSVGLDHVKNVSKEFNDNMVSLTDFEDEEGETNHAMMLDPCSDPLDILIAEETEDAMRVEMDALPPKQHQAFVMRELEGLEYAAIAEETDSTEVAVRYLVSVAKATLQDKFLSTP